MSSTHLAIVDEDEAELGEVKQRARAAWAAGEYDRIADLHWEVGARIVNRVGVGPEEDVLDPVCGTANAAIRAAHVWRFDSVPEAVETFAATLGPVEKARALLEPQGRWIALREEIAAWFEHGNRSGTDEVSLPVEYLVVLGQKHGRKGC